jgi:hypothetical protein
MSMKGRITAAALSAAVLLPATAGAVPPGNTSVPLGSTAACFIVSTPAAPATCNFVGSADAVGYGGIGNGSFTITHKRKYAVCGPDRTITGFAVENVTDEEGTMAPAGSQTGFLDGIVYTAKLDGVGFFAVGGPGTPGPDAAADPAVGPGPDFAGAQDGTGGQKVGDAC